MKSLGLLLMATVLLSSCAKQPEASFNTDRSVYSPGETVHLNNTSIDAYSYTWILPDGSISSSENVDFQLSNNAYPGYYTFTLEAISRRGNKSDIASQTIEVVEPRGSAVFWQHPSGGFGVTTVYLDMYTSTITADHYSNPGCSSGTAAVFNDIPVGNYSFTASDGNSSWNGAIQITSNGCSSMQLY